MTSDESRAIAFVGVLLLLATAARVINRPKPITITAGQVDISAFRAAGQSLAQTSATPKPPKGTSTAQSTQTLAAASRSGPLDLNRATAAELEALPGIGPAVAQRIIARRDTVRRFEKVEDLDPIKGIGPVLIEKIRPLVVVK